jgi:hypothetical protein
MTPYLPSSSSSVALHSGLQHGLGANSCGSESKPHWAEVNGRVTNSEVIWGYVEISYEYEIAGRRFQSKHEISLAMVPFRGLAAARRFNDAAKSVIADYPPGQILALKYNPMNERQSVLTSG